MEYSKLPAETRRSAMLYIEHGQPPGGFLSALFSNDLLGTYGKADPDNRAALPEWCQFIFNETPHGCHGSASKVSRWIEQGGLKGGAS